jgi:two-component system, response regulator, stage 0 sporulation protein F
MTCRILVVDDSTPIQKVIKIAFTKYAVTIQSAGSLNEALKECEKAKPDLIIADASIPGVGSAQDFSRLLAKSQGGAMVMLMGSYDAVKESDLRAAGFETIVKKPFDAVELLAACESLMPGKLVLAGAGSASSSPQLAPPTARSSAPQFSLDDAVSSIPKGPPSLNLDGPTSKPQVPSGKLGQPNAEGVPAFLIDPNPDLNVQIPPLPKIELGQKGRKAFDAPTEGSSGGLKAAMSAPKPAFDRPQGLDGAAASQIPQLVEKAVVKYCQDHFKETAREVLTNELRRLADEKAKYLVDT